jgi:hypothetical protein
MLGQRSFLRVAQDENISVAIPMIAINFACFMISNLIYKINDFPSISFELSEIISGNTSVSVPHLGEIQRKFGDFTPLALEQYKLREKSRHKLPKFAASGCLLVQRAFEQSSSEAVACWKAHHFNAKRILSITGGLGVDEWAWATEGAEVKSVDIQHDLNALVRYNQRRLGISYERLDGEAREILERETSWNPDWVYADPDRRDGHERLSGYWEKYEPKIADLMDTYGSYYPRWIIKLSPMTDFRVVRTSLPGAITFISVYYQQEVKELLVQVDLQQAQSTSFVSVTLQGNGVQYTRTEDILAFCSKISQEKTAAESRFIFEPHGGLNVLGLNPMFLGHSGLTAQTPHATLFTSNVAMPEHWGRSKIITSVAEGSLNTLQKWLKEHRITGASLTVRDARGMNAHDVRKHLGLKEDHQHFVFITYQGKRFKAWLCV